MKRAFLLLFFVLLVAGCGPREPSLDEQIKATKLSIDLAKIKVDGFRDLEESQRLLAKVSESGASNATSAAKRSEWKDKASAAAKEADRLADDIHKLKQKIFDDEVKLKVLMSQAGK